MEMSAGLVVKCVKKVFFTKDFFFPNEMELNHCDEIDIFQRQFLTHYHAAKV